MNLSYLTGNYAAIDYGISNTDVITLVKGEVRTAKMRTHGEPSPGQVVDLLAACGTDPSVLELIATTGGRHRTLPAAIEGIQIAPVGELEAIARGGQALAGLEPSALDEPLIVVSAGSGTAYMEARGRAYRHVIGSGVGGGTMLGLARLLLGTTNPQVIDRLALEGDANGVDLALSDVVAGPIGTLPPDTTAVNFGRMARSAAAPAREDIAAGIVTLVGQVVATLAVTAARGEKIERAVFTGHLTDMQSMRTAIARVSHFFGMPLEMPENAGFSTAAGALLYAVEQK